LNAGIKISACGQGMDTAPGYAAFIIAEIKVYLLAKTHAQRSATPKYN